MRKIVTKHGGRCISCGDWIDQGKEVMWDPDEKNIAHESCLIKDEVDRRQAPIASLIQSKGESPATKTVAEGEIVIDRTTIYGGGYWYVIGSDWIWHVQNNGGDGDNWDLNNVEGFGAGGIGWRVPYDEQMARDLRDIATILNSCKPF
jgi:hypothetical protein